LDDGAWLVDGACLVDGAAPFRVFNGDGEITEMDRSTPYRFDEC